MVNNERNISLKVISIYDMFLRENILDFVHYIRKVVCQVSLDFDMVCIFLTNCELLNMFKLSLVHYYMYRLHKCIFQMRTEDPFSLEVGMGTSY